VNQFLELNFTDSTITITFSETVNISTANFSHITIQNKDDSEDSGFVSYTLTDGSTESQDGNRIVIQITDEDLNIIKARKKELLLCALEFACHLRVSDGFISDMSGNKITPVTDNDGINFFVQNLYDDEIRPNAISFTLNMTSNIMSIEFDESMDYNSFRPEFIEIQGSFNATTSITLEPVESRLITMEYVTTLEFELSEDDVLNIKADDNIATEENNTYIVFSSGMVTDTVDLAVNPRVNGIDSLKVSEFTPDRISPEVEES